MSRHPDSWRPPYVKLVTSAGAILVELYWQHAPRTCLNFAELADRNYYNNVKVHRVIKDFMIQTGDPTATGTGGTSIYGPSFSDEITKELKHTGAGILSMANSGPNTNGCQFFITCAKCEYLDGKHVVFGKVVDGLLVLRKIESVATGANNKPRIDVVIKQCGEM
eukprot:m.27989 g.27989  ORF g.27989 m.27989 type:complete len:165 (-) comp39984_c0_seq3:346-840(-)